MRRVIIRRLHAYELADLILDHVIFKALFTVIANENYFMTTTVIRLVVSLALLSLG